MFEEQCPSSFNIDMQQYDQPPQKTKRFASLNEKQLDELLDGAHSKSTKYSTNHAISVYKGKII